MLAQCAAPAGFDVSLLGIEDLKTSCFHASAQCSTFINTPTAAVAPATEPQMNVWMHKADVNKTSFIARSACVAELGSCYDNFPKQFIKCAGLNTAGPIVTMETYDLPAELIAQACMIKGCHFFVSNNDNSGGTMYKFASGVVPNVTTTDSYIKLV